MSRAIVTIVVAVLAAIAPAVAHAAPLAPETLTLRLPDLGPGYAADSGPCYPKPLTDRFSPHTLRRLTARFPHTGCQIHFDQAWLRFDRSRPAGIESAAFSFDSESGPEAAMRQERALIALLIGADRDDLTDVPSGDTIGDESHVLQTDSYAGPGFAVLWRSGPVLALVSATGRPGTVVQQSVLQLAATQQARIAAPTLVLPADFDDLELSLDDPSFRLPVQWLGRELPGRGGRSALSLYGASGPPRIISANEPNMLLQYGRERRSGVEIYVHLSLWRPSAGRRLLRERELGRICSRRFDVDLDGVDATIFGSYEPPGRHCEQGPPENWTALAIFRAVTVTIDADGGTPCNPGRSEYDSLAGMRALLRALRSRDSRPAPNAATSARAHPAPPAAASTLTAAPAASTCRA